MEKNTSMEDTVRSVYCNTAVTDELLFDILKMAIADNQVELFKWITSIFHKHKYCHDLFEDACYRGRLSIAKFIYDNYEHSASLNYSKALQRACVNGHLKTAKWILSIRSIKINCSRIFQIACYHGYIDIAKMILSIDPEIDISKNNEEAFRFACLNGHIKMAKWLLRIKPDINISIENDFAFYASQETCNFHISKWLSTIYQPSASNANKHYSWNLYCVT